MKRPSVLFCLLAILTLFSSCGVPAPAPESEPPVPPAAEDLAGPAAAPEEAEPRFVDPLTGLPAQEDLSADRPVAVMLNNLKKALPQCGVSEADIIYEAPVEGGITRMMGVFQSVRDVELIGTVRSARPYYAELALGLDAIYLHAGGSPGAYSAIRKYGVTSLDCVNGPYEGTLFWRDPVRRKSAGAEHSVLTSGEKILTLFPAYAGLRRTHGESYVCPLRFTADGTPADGERAETVTVRFSNHKTGVFRYDADSGSYLAEEYGAPYVDGNNGRQVAVRNVLVIRTDIGLIPGDTAGRLNVRLTGGGSGYFACGGKCVPIRWSKADPTAPLLFFDENGEALELGAGKSYVNIVSMSASVTAE